jgi:membrane protein DedA with SNARE-associated domain
MDFIRDAIQIFESFATKMPLELFVLLGSFIEEVIAPIPSPFIMTLSGSIAKAQDQAIFYLILLSFFGAIGKTLGAWVLYIIADKAEDVIVGKYGKFFGVTHKEIESIGRRFNKGLRDDVFLFLARAIPIIPSAPVSVVCGLIKLNIRTYLLSTFLGTSVRNMLYLYVGYVGLSSYESVLGGLDSVESIVQIVIGVGIVGIIGWAYYKRKKSQL